MWLLRLGTVVMLTFMASIGARADEQMQPLAASGAWLAAEHSESAIAAPDVCIVMNVDSGVGFRADQDHIEMRIIDRSWSLPANVRGIVKISVGAYYKEFDIEGNEHDGVAIALPRDEILLLFAAMDKSASMTVTPGTAKPKSVSLSGSTKATNAFRTCAGIESSGPGGGANPFGTNK